VEKRYFRPDEVATMLDVTVRTIQLWAKAGTIPAVKINGVLRIPKLELEKTIKVGRGARADTAPTAG
jgi:excisionase family DNA binding protein